MANLTEWLSFYGSPVLFLLIPCLGLAAITIPFCIPPKDRPRPNWQVHLSGPLIALPVLATILGAAIYPSLLMGSREARVGRTNHIVSNARSVLLRNVKANSGRYPTQEEWSSIVAQHGLAGEENLVPYPVRTWPRGSSSQCDLVYAPPPKKRVDDTPYPILWTRGPIDKKGSPDLHDRKRLGRYVAFTDAFVRYVEEEEFASMVNSANKEQ